MNSLLRHPAMKEIEKALKREVWEMLVIGVMFLIGGVFLMYLSKTTYFFLGIIGFLLLAPGLYLLYKTFQNQDLESSQVIRALRDKRQSIVWIYPFVTQVMPFGISLFARCYIIMKLADGTECSFQIPIKKKKLILGWLKRLLPHVRFGFSKERETLYGESPESFLNRNWDK